MRRIFPNDLQPSIQYDDPHLFCLISQHTQEAFVREFAQVGRAVSELGLVFILDSVVVSVRSPGTMRNAYQDQGSTLGKESRYHSLERGKNSREDSPGSQTTGKCPYKLLHQPEPGYEEERTRSVLFGRSQRRYGHVATHLAETFGFSASTVGRVLIQETAKALDTFMNLMTRSLWDCSSTARPYAVSK